MRHDVAYLGKVRKIVDSRGRDVINYRYDKLTGNVIRVRDMVGNDINFKYGQNGKLALITRRAANQDAPEPVRSFHYDNRNNLTRIATLNARGKTVVATHLTYTLFENEIKPFEYIKTYYNVQAWKVDFQSICDSAYYNGKDSTLRLYGSPIMWNDSNQFTASEAIVYMANNEVERIELEADAFIFSKVDSTAINQVSGNNIVGYLKESKLYKADVSGNALSVYFIEEEPDSTQVDAPKEPSYVGINKAESSELFLYFTEDNKIKRLVMTPQSNGVLHSPKKAKDTKVTRLAGYQDHQSLRPTSKTDIYIPKKREALTAEEPAAKARKKRRNRD